MGGLVYSGKFEQKINELYSPKNIQETAKKFAEYEKKNGPYKFGQGYTKHIVPKADDWADEAGSTAGHAKWEKHSGDIPEHIRNRLTEVISSNLKSAHPLPMVLKVGENVDGDARSARAHLLAQRSRPHRDAHTLPKHFAEIGDVQFADTQEPARSVRSAGFIVLRGRRPVYGFMAASVVLFSADRGGKDASPCYEPVAGGRCTVAGSRCNGEGPRLAWFLCA